jgi:hypothetical protein
VTARAPRPARPPAPEFRPVADLRRDPANARTHDAAQIEAIAASIRRFGWTYPVLCDDVVRAGHGRLDAAELIYHDPDPDRRVIHMAPGPGAGGARVPDGCVPVLDCSGWSAEERVAYALADNKLPLLAGWDDDALRSQLAVLEDAGFEVALTGFDPGEVTMLVAAAGTPTDPYAEWSGMPEFDQQDRRPFRSIPVHFGSQDDLDRFLAATGLRVTPQTRYLWYPETPVERYADKQYADGGA